MNTTANHQDDYDSPWKEGMELYFKELMQFFFPNIARSVADLDISWFGIDNLLGEDQEHRAEQHTNQIAAHVSSSTSIHFPKYSIHLIEGVLEKRKNTIDFITIFGQYNEEP